MRSIKIDAIIKDLEELKLRAPRGDQLLNSNYGRLERLLFFC
jgi:hypothetical protein